MGQHLLPEGAAPSTPSTGYVSMYAKADGLLYSKDDAGVETQLALALGVTAGKAQQVDQTVVATVRAATTDFTGESLEGTLSNSGVTITAFHGVAGVTYKRKCLGAGRITARIGLTIPQGRASINTAAGDTFEVYMLTSTTCEVRNYQRAVDPKTAETANTTANNALAGGHYGQTWQTVTGSRVKGTNYTNTTGRFIQVVVVVSTTAPGQSLLLTVNGVIAVNFTAMYSYNHYATALIPPDAVFSVSGTFGSIQSWTELS